jgi:serralysin
MCTICQALNPTAPRNFDMHTDAYDTVSDYNEDGDLVRSETLNSGDSVTVEDGNSSNGKPVYSLDQIADYLTTGYWEDTNPSFRDGAVRKFDLNSSKTLTIDVTGLNSQGKLLAREALETWSDVTGITFQEVSNNADITFDDNDRGAYAGSTFSWNGSYYAINSSTVNVSTNWLATQGTSLTSYSFQTYIHEIGHALGLGHAGDYNGFASYANDAVYANDSWQATVMSYFSESENGYVDASFGYVLTPQMADILAIQNLYGDASSARGSNTTYGVGATADANVDVLGTHAVTLFDGGGVDTINLSSRNNDQRLDLNEETFSDVNGRIGNLAIARDTVIENAVLGNGDDTILGNSASNDLDGGAGADSLFGGGGFDYAVYTRSTSRVDIRLDDATASGGHATGDTLTGIEGIKASNYDDYLSGSSGANNLYGNGGNDYLRGNAGGDLLDGGAGTDVANYWTSNGRVDIRLDEGTANGGHATGDVLVNIENITATRYDDYLSGDNGDNVLFGWAGNDYLRGNAGADVLDGGSGTDLANYWTSNGRVDIRLDEGTATGGHATGDVLIDIENITGTRYDDYLSGDSGGNVLFGWAGNDYLRGNAGADVLNGGSGNDQANYWTSNGRVDIRLDEGTATGGHATGDVLIDIENITGTRYDDYLSGDNGANVLLGWAGNDYLRGNAGADVLNGGSGIDQANYWKSNAAIEIDLSNGTASGGHADGDVLIDIENITGSRFGDEISGDNGANVLFGWAGKDILNGGRGNDTLTGGSGDDIFVFENSFDRDTITDFAINRDVIDLSSVNSINNWNDLSSNHLSQSGGNTIIDAGSGNVITVEGISVAALDQYDFLFV